MTPAEYVVLIEKLDRVEALLETADHVAEHETKRGVGVEIAELEETATILRSAYTWEHGGDHNVITP